MKTLEKIFLIDYNEFDGLVKLHLNQDADYDVVASMEYSNDEDHLFNIEPENERDLLPDSYYNKYDKKEMEEFILNGKWRKYNPSAHQILAYLARELNAIPFGYYLLRISW